jgi:hypothetical protein
MELCNARNFGQRQLTKTTSIIIGVCLIVFILFGLQGDYENGILYVFEAITNIWTILFFGLFFLTSFFWGGKAGEKIILLKKNYVGIAVKYACFTYLTLIIYNITITCLTQKILTIQQMTILIISNLWIVIPILTIWLWSTNKIYHKNKNEEAA